MTGQFHRLSALLATTPTSSPRPSRSLPELSAAPDPLLYPTCPACDQTEGYVLRPEDPEGRWQRCPACWRLERTLRAERRLLDAGLTSEEIQRHRLERFQVDHEVQGEMLQSARAFVEGTLAAWSLALAGGMGTGKTHLLVGVVMAALAAGSDARYATTPALFAEMRRAIAAGGDPDALVDVLIAAELLALDELPAVDALTDWRADQLDRLINDRYRARRPTIVASNHLPPAWPPRVRDRLAEGVIVLAVGLPSWRAR
jgi:DNA replication protein DnaC